MPVLRYSGGSTYNLANGPTFTDEDDQHEVDAATAERLLRRPDFEDLSAVDDEPDGPIRVDSYVRQDECGYYDPDAMTDACPRDAGWGTDRTEGPCADHSDLLDEDAAFPDDAEAEPTPDADRTARVGELAEKHWQTTVTIIENGEADDVLDRLEPVDERNSVQEAIDDRRTELDVAESDEGGPSDGASPDTTDGSGESEDADETEG
jgi:hypothetical protein